MNEVKLMSRRLPRKDVVIVGFGWTGAIMANELTDEGLDVIAFERGPWRDAPTDFPPSYMNFVIAFGTSCFCARTS
jgi:gluconate 2-dehydrogenase alpha chain